MIPNIQKSNHRYRGPQESKKQHDFYIQAKKNIEDLKEAYDSIKDINDFINEDLKEDLLYIENKIELIMLFITSELEGGTMLYE